MDEQEPRKDFCDDCPVRGIEGNRQCWPYWTAKDGRVMVCMKDRGNG